jgi:hypothetical protein
MGEPPSVSSGCPAQIDDGAATFVLDNLKDLVQVPVVALVNQQLRCLGRVGNQRMQVNHEFRGGARQRTSWHKLRVP